MKGVLEAIIEEEEAVHEEENGNKGKRNKRKMLDLKMWKTSQKHSNIRKSSKVRRK